MYAGRCKASKSFDALSISADDAPDHVSPERRIEKSSFVTGLPLLSQARAAANLCWNSALRAGIVYKLSARTARAVDAKSLCESGVRNCTSPAAQLPSGS